MLRLPKQNPKTPSPAPEPMARARISPDRLDEIVNALTREARELTRPWQPRSVVLSVQPGKTIELTLWVASPVYPIEPEHFARVAMALDRHLAENTTRAEFKRLRLCVEPA